MKKLTVILAVIILLTGCNRQTAPLTDEGTESGFVESTQSESRAETPPETSYTVESEDSDEHVDEDLDTSLPTYEMPPEPVEIEYAYLTQPERLDMTGWTLGKLARDYLNLSEADFMAGHNRQDLMSRGNTVYQIQDFPDKAIGYNGIDLFSDQELIDYGIPDLWQTHSSSIFGLSYGKGYEGEILQGVSIGTPLKKVVELWGEPQFVNERLSLKGYKGNLFYIAVIGDDKVDKIYLQKYLPLPEEYEDFLILNQLGYYCEIMTEQKEAYKAAMDKIIQKMELRTADIDEILYRTSGSSFGEVDRYSPYGFFETYSVWYPGKPHYNISLSADYKGKVPAGFAESDPGYAVRDLDEAEGQLYRHILWDMWMEKCVEKAVVSPDGTMAFWVEESPRFYSGYGNIYTIYLFFLREKRPYMEMNSRNFEPKGWKDNRFITCENTFSPIDEGEWMLDVTTGEMVQQ